MPLFDRHALHDLGVKGQVSFHRRQSFASQAAVDECLQIVFADGATVLGHFTLRSSGTRPVSRIDRSRCLARDSLDITVPIGRPRMRAAAS